MNRTTQTLLAAVTVAAAVAVSAAPVQAQPRLRHIPSSASAAAAFSPARTGVESSTLAAALAAHPVTVTPRAGDGWISFTGWVCGSSATWRQQQARNGGSAWLYLGRRYSIDCGLTGAAAPAAVPSTSTWARPLGGSWCFTPNGSREFGTNRGDHRHGGIDLGAPVGADYGDPVRAIHAGVAHHGYQAGGAGTYVWVDHGDGSSAWFFHLSGRAVGNGARVAAGQTIGYVGASGNATAVHVHLEVKVGGTRVDPVAFLSARGVPIRC